MFGRQKKFEQAVANGEFDISGMDYSSYYKDSFKRLKKNKMAMFCAFIVAALILIAVFAPVISPYDPYKQDYMAVLRNQMKITF